jgi:hypothetical protein
MPASDATMAGGTTSAPVTNGQEGAVLWVGGDERETFLKTIRVSGSLGSVSVLELDQKYRTTPLIARGFLLNSNSDSIKRAKKLYTPSSKLIIISFFI